MSYKDFFLLYNKKNIIFVNVWHLKKNLTDKTKFMETSTEISMFYLDSDPNNSETSLFSLSASMNNQGPL